jgi:hypothetical protein
VNKIKLIADKTIKQANDLAAQRNETLSVSEQKSVTPLKSGEMQQNSMLTR